MWVYKSLIVFSLAKILSDLLPHNSFGCVITIHIPIDVVQCELSKRGTGCLRGESLIQDTYMHVGPTTGGMPGQAEWQDKVIEEGRTKTNRGLLFILRLWPVQFFVQEQDVKCNNGKKKIKRDNCEGSRNH